MKKVLVVEDDRFLSTALTAKFKTAGFETRVAHDGLEALEVVKDFMPDIILLDLVMPRLDGFGVLEKLKDDEKLKHIPVIVASNLGQGEDIQRSKELGASDYIIKTNLSLQQLVEMVKKKLGLDV